MKEMLIYGIIYLFVIFIFLLFVFRAIFFCFVIKQDPIKSVIPKKPTGLFKIFVKEKKEANNSKWG